jgi:SPP1 family predicted phage head-tail adaptor
LTGCDITTADLREQIVVQRKSLAGDGAGGHVVTWRDLFATRAKVKPLSGREALQAMQLQASITHRIYIRYRKDLTESDRIILRGQPLQIRAIINIDLKDRWIDISCDAGVAT